MSAVLTRAELYCLVPRHLAEAVLEPLRAHLECRGVRVIEERRATGERPSYEIRRQRAMHLPRELGELPAEIAEYRDELRLVQRMPPAGLELADTGLVEVVEQARDGDAVAAAELIWRMNVRVAARLARMHGTVTAAAQIEPALGRLLDRVEDFAGHCEADVFAWVDATVDGRPAS